ncbi:hypothetical protein MMC07_001562 [Pseudocyphellaria aurata]|nr:hypothetical protein [Pseudocyphellaria aurata]
MDILRKHQLEVSLHEEQKLIENGRLKEDSPLDMSDSFGKLCEACRKGDLKSCQEMILEGVNINARDQFDYTPLILASLCGHYEVVQLLLESGALCERDTFQGERCLYNALNDKIRNLLLSEDYSKSRDPLQPFAAHITSLLSRGFPKTSDILVTTSGESFQLHKYILSARSPYFSKRLAVTSATILWKLPSVIPPQAFEIAMKYIYLGEVPADVGGGPGTGSSEEEILEGIDKITEKLEIRSLWTGILESSDRRLVRQRRTEEVEKGRNQLEEWFRENVLRHKVLIHTSNADDVKWDRDNSIFADVLLRADEPENDHEPEEPATDSQVIITSDSLSDLMGIPVGPIPQASRSPSRIRAARRSVLFPVQRAMLLRSDFFLAMFSSAFREAQASEHLQIVTIDCSPDVLEVILTYLYTEKTDIPLELAVDVLLAADLLFIERLKTKAAVVLSTLGNGSMPQKSFQQDVADLEPEEEVINIYDVVRAGWFTRVPRIEEFAARYFAHRLESYIEEPEFAELIQESALRIQGRQETDSIELLDEIRYYLSERFRLRFEDPGLEEMMDEEAAASLDAATYDAGPDTVKIAEHLGSGSKPENSGDEQLKTGSTSLHSMDKEQPMLHGEVRTLDGEVAGDEFAEAAINYQVLLGKIDTLLESLKLDA